MGPHINTTLARLDTNKKHSSALDSFTGPTATSTAGTSVDYLDNFNRYGLRNSLFSTNQFSELYLDPLVTNDNSNSYGTSPLYDTRPRQWSNSATTNCNSRTKRQHGDFIKRFQEMVQQQLGPDNVLSTFECSGSVRLNGEEGAHG